MKRWRWRTLALVLGIFAGTVPVWAQNPHDHGSHGGMKMDTREVLAEGIKVTFMVMANDEHRVMLKNMKMEEDIQPGTTHNVTVALTDPETGQEIPDAAVTMKVVAPGGDYQIRPLAYKPGMKSHDGYFNLPGPGRYELLVLIKAGGQKKAAGVFYDLK